MASNDDPFAKYPEHRHSRRRPERTASAESASWSRPPSASPFGVRHGSATPFAESAKHLSVHPQEKALLCLVLVHLVFLPWALGTMVLWAQQVSLGLAIASFALALVPRTYTSEQSGSHGYRMLPWRKLFRFPIFWLGLALLALVACHGLNPAWELRRDGRGWWMQAIEHVSWLPSGVRVPFKMWGPWRMLMIYGSAWLTVCTIWIGFTRRRTLRTFFIALAVNAVALAVVGFSMRFTGATKLVWLAEAPSGAALFSSFIYKNHAGAYLDLGLAITCALSGWYYLRGVRRLEKSNPTAIFAFLAVVIAFAVIISAARGATLTMIAYLAIACGTLVVHQIFFAPSAAKRRVIAITLLVLAAVSLPAALEAIDSDTAIERIRVGFANGGDYSLRSRIVATQASGDMLADHWTLGTGVGSFRFLFPIYQQKYPEIFYFAPGVRQYWEHAHNDWMEIPIEFGLPGLAIVGLSLGWFLKSLFRHRFWRHPCGGLTIAGLVLVAMYSRWDFPFQNPAILTLWCALWPATLLWTKKEDPRSMRSAQT